MPELALPDPDATARLGRRIAAWLRPGDSVLLRGPLGAGKTALARAILRAATGDPTLEVPSPTFTLVQSYDGPRFALHHFDLWRLPVPADPAALAELGWDEARDGVVVVEWPDRLGALTPDPALAVGLDLVAATGRRATLSGWPDRVAAG